MSLIFSIKIIWMNVSMFCEQQATISQLESRQIVHVSFCVLDNRSWIEIEWISRQKFQDKSSFKTIRVTIIILFSFFFLVCGVYFSSTCEKSCIVRKMSPFVRKWTEKKKDRL